MHSTFYQEIIRSMKTHMTKRLREYVSVIIQNRKGKSIVSLSDLVSESYQNAMHRTIQNINHGPLGIPSQEEIGYQPVILVIDESIIPEWTQ
jgi:hypothetical protein